MEDEETATIMESSLFFSCMSSASYGNDDENDGGTGGKASQENARAEGGALSSVDNGKQVSDDVRGISSTQNQNAEGVDNTKAKSSNTNNADICMGSNPSSNSNSSWSVLSEKERPLVRSITFNRDRTCLIVSTTAGVRIRTLESLNLSLENLHVNDGSDGDGNDNTNNKQSSWIHDVPLPPDGATYAQLLHNTSLLAVIKPSSPRCVFLYNAKNASSPLAALPLSAAVKRVELQRRVLAAMTVDLRLHVFHMTEDGGGGDNVQQKNATIGGKEDGFAEKKPLRPTLITTLNIMHPSDSPRNVTRGLNGYNAGSYFDLSANYLVCKSFNGTPGTVRVYDPTIVHSMASVSSCNASIGSGMSAVSTASSWDKYNSPPTTKKIKRRLHLLTTINAHDHSVTRMLIGGGGKDQQTFLATVSSKGTTIRVFGLPTGEHLWEWHRGSRACQFYSLCWNGNADRLASFGSSGTIHIFDWQKKKQLTELTESVDGLEFEKVDDDAPPRDVGKTQGANSKPLLKRIGSSIKRHATGGSSNTTPSKHRSMTKMKYKPSVMPANTTASAGASVNTAKSQPLVLALVDRNDRDDNKTYVSLAEKEDTLVLCSMDGELRQYSVKSDKSIGVVQIEDILARR